MDSERARAGRMAGQKEPRQERKRAVRVTQVIQAGRQPEVGTGIFAGVKAPIPALRKHNRRRSSLASSG